MGIKELRDLTDKSQREFAMYFGIPINTLRDWEHGRRKPKQYIINMMKRILVLEKEIFITNDKIEE